LLQASHNYRERGMNTLLFTSKHYASEAGHISSRIGLSSKAELFSEEDDLLNAINEMHQENPIHCVFIDEAQFLTADQVWQIARVADRLDIPIMCYGLRTDFQGKMFPGSKRRCRLDSAPMAKHSQKANRSRLKSLLTSHCAVAIGKNACEPGRRSKRPRHLLALRKVSPHLACMFSGNQFRGVLKWVASEAP